MKCLVALASLALALGACGKEGPPVPPERRLPVVISDLSGTIEGERIVLRWTNPDKRADQSRLRDLASVHIYRRDESDGGPPKAALISWGRVVGYDQIASIKLDAPAPAEVQGRVVRWADQSVKTGRRYVYVVTAVDSIGRASPPSNLLLIVTLSAPRPVVSLEAKSGERQVSLSWAAPATAIDGSRLSGILTYQLLRAQAPTGPFEAVGAPIAQTSITDTELENERPYYYAVRAIRSDEGSQALSGLSPVVTATPADLTPPPAPANLVAVPTEGSVRLAWDPSPAPDLAGYHVYRANAPAGEFTQVTPSAVPTPVFIDRSVERGRSYRYAVSAIDRATKPNESPRSQEISVTVP